MNKRRAARDDIDDDDDDDDDEHISEYKKRGKLEREFHIKINTFL